MIFKIMIIFIFMFCLLQFIMYFDLIKKFIITLCTKLFVKKNFSYSPNIKKIKNSDLRLKRR